MTNTPHPSARYEARAQRYADAFQDETLPKFPVDRNMIRMLVDLVGEHPRVLDAGCGTGQVTKMLRNWGCDAVGVGAAEKLIALARTAYPGLAFTVGDLRALPYPDRDFDALIARYSVIHTAPGEVPTVVAEFARVLRPGGCLLVEFQSSGSAPTHAFDHAAAPAGAWNPDEFAALLVRAGLVERARLLCPAQPDLKYAGTPGAHLIFRKSGPRSGPSPSQGDHELTVVSISAIQSDIQRVVIGRTGFTLGCICGSAYGDVEPEANGAVGRIEDVCDPRE